MLEPRSTPYEKCTHGHDYTPENSQIGPDCKRRCRECVRQRGRKRVITPERKNYMKSYQADWMNQRRLDYFRDKVCVDCAGTEDLELDHIDTAMKDTHRIWSWTQARRETEIAKCAPRCKKCHALKTHRHRLETVDQSHGTSWKYRTDRCRCDECRSWNAASKKEQRHAREADKQRNRPKD